MLFKKLLCAVAVVGAFGCGANGMAEDQPGDGEGSDFEAGGAGSGALEDYGEVSDNGEVAAAEAALEVQSKYYEVRMCFPEQGCATSYATFYSDGTFTSTDQTTGFWQQQGPDIRMRAYVGTTLVGQLEGTRSGRGFAGTIISPFGGTGQWVSREVPGIP